MKPVLLLSNGHGEDLSGALVAAELMQRGIPVEALPLVGHGSPYRQRGVPVLGRTRSCSTGGLGYTSLRGRLSELLEGQMGHVLGRLLLLRRRRRHYGLVVAVGDVLAVLGSWLSGLPSAVYLVAYSSHYEGRLRLPWPCGWLLNQASIKTIWSRDSLTANDLSQQLKRAVVFLGNPFLDVVSADTSESLPLPALQLALVPGSRLPEAARNFALMLRVLALLPEEWARSQPLRLRAALVPELDGSRVAKLAGSLGWRLEASNRLVRGPLAVELGWGQFGEILASSQLVLCMAGTAAEQAVGLGKPVLQLVGQGPQFTAGFAEAQRRLLGPGVRCAPGSSGSAASLAATAQLAQELLEQQSDPKQGPALRQSLAAIGLERIGAPGGSQAIAAAIMAMLRPNQGL
ncbi:MULTISPECIES: lipid-A-disaccharide synthase-related protein [unclassified Cyanobium]|uniref:lipid-A-disaccharide synthase-related protein n=1 Tax=unclassified Cyanobium TaxID=2627006 RepID=UPI0020CDD042|nr:MULTISPECIES: lipid-A-disaccharide synthase-related protein [unclassified Cyanobium]MCP9779073.1 lipid-A-disaccharide synthase-related protein [Cyanobium sp. Tous-M-B4]MCP9876908.1 lipid-A-disaccharide synthase-related protein [Cyanobium sp. A2C-AMD]